MILTLLVMVLTSWNCGNSNNGNSTSIQIQIGEEINELNEENRTQLFEAVLGSDEASLSNLLAAGANSNIPDADGKTPLMHAVEAKSKGMVNIILATLDNSDEVDVDPNLVSETGETARLLARQIVETDPSNADAAIILNLLEGNDAGGYTTSVNSQLNPIKVDSNGKTAAHLLAANGRDDLLARIREEGDDNTFNISDNDGRTPLMDAAENKKQSTIDYIISNSDSSILDKVSNNGSTALALAHMDKDTGAFLLTGAVNVTGASNNPTDPNKNNKSALMIAAENSNVNTINALVELGADPDGAHSEGDNKTAIIYAIEAGKVASVSQLISKNASTTQKDTNDKSPLMYAVEEDLAHNLNMTGIISSSIPTNDIKLNDVSLDGRTAIMYAATVGNSSAITTLVNHGADVSKINSSGNKTALHYAAENAKADAVEVLLSNNNVNATLKDSNNNTALMYAVLSEDDGTVSKFESAHLDDSKDVGANIMQNSDGITALVLAHKNNVSNNILNALNSLGESLTYSDNNGKTLLMFASENGTLNTVTTIITKLADFGAEASKATASSGDTALTLASGRGTENEANDIVNAILFNSGISNQKIVSLATQTNSAGESSISIAYSSGYFDIADNIERAGVALSGVNVNGKTLLMLASEQGNNASVQHMLAAANVNNGTDKSLKASEKNSKNENDNNKTALMYAVENGKTDVITSLLGDNEVRADLIASDGATALIYAYNYNTTDSGISNGMVNALLASQNTLDSSTLTINSKIEGGMTPLMVAASTNSSVTTSGAIIDTIISNSGDVNLTNNDGLTALMYTAVSNNENGHAQKLIDAGANKTLYDNNGKTAQVYALDNTNDVNALYNLNESERNLLINNKTALMQAVETGTIDIVNKLIQVGVDVTTVTVNDGTTASGGQTALHKVCQLNAHDSVAKISSLIAADSSVLEMRVADTLDTALTLAAEEGLSDAVTALVATHNADVNAISETGKTPLLAAHIGGDAATINAFNSTAALINPSNSSTNGGEYEDKSALMYASEATGSANSDIQTEALTVMDNIFAQLSDSGAASAINEFDAVTGKTPLMYAAKFGHEPAVTKILSKVDDLVTSGDITSKNDILTFQNSVPDTGNRKAHGTTALMFASDYNRSNIITTLSQAYDNTNGDKQTAYIDLKSTTDDKTAENYSTTPGINIKEIP